MSNFSYQEIEQNFLQLKKDLTNLKNELKNLGNNEFHLIVENAGEGIVVVQDFKIVYANKKISQITKYSVEEIKSLPLETFVYKDDLDRVLLNLEKRFKGLPVEKEYDFRLVTKDGEIRWFHIRPVIIQWNGKKAVLDFLVDITERKKLEQNLENAISILNATLESSYDAILVVSKDREVLYYNNKFLEMWGIPKESVKTKPTTELLKIAKQKVKNPDEFERKVQKLYKNNDYYSHDFIEMKDGKLLERYSVPYEVDGEAKGIVWFTRDITEKKKFEQKIIESEKKYRELVETVNSIVLRWKPDGTITFINKFGASFFEYDIDELVGKNVLDTIVPDKSIDGRNLNLMIKDIVRNPFSYEKNENENITKTGKRVWILWANKPVFDESGKLVEILSIGNDITEKKEYEKKLIKLATTDILTGVYNRLKFEEIFRQKIEDSKRYGNILSLAVIDIDFFKKINDTYGHQTGDKVLKGITSLIKNSIRKSDIFARWGGEEFVLLLPEIPKEKALILLERLRKAIERTDFHGIKTTISIGLTQFFADDDEKTFLSRADKALYKAKEAGRNKVIML